MAYSAHLRFLFLDPAMERGQWSGPVVWCEVRGEGTGVTIAGTTIAIVVRCGGVAKFAGGVCNRVVQCESVAGWRWPDSLYDIHKGEKCSAMVITSGYYIIRFNNHCVGIYSGRILLVV